MERTEKHLRERLEKYLEEKETYLNKKEARIESDLKESYERIEKDLKLRYAEIHLAQTEADKKHIRCPFSSKMSCNNPEQFATTHHNLQQPTTIPMRQKIAKLRRIVSCVHC